MRSSVWVFGAISLGALVLACGSKPPGGGATDGTGGSSGGGLGQAGNGNLSFVTEEPPDPTVVCRTSDSCDALECGPIADGCGDFIQCGGCDAPATCGGAGVPSHCGVPGSGGSGGGGNCVPDTCETLGVVCGQHGDGCGNVIQCSPCGNGTECVQGQCQATSSCELLTCDDYPEPGRCGPVSDGCSGILNCPFGACGAGEGCGAQEPGFCGAQTCQVKDCFEATLDKPAGYCGFVSDGCAGEVPNCAQVCDSGAGESCGVIQDGEYVQVCGTGGGACTPLTEQQACAGKCGVVSDNCTSTFDCGIACQPDEICGANGQPNVCGAPACVPQTCQQLGAQCGDIDDGCGGQLNCGGCTAPESCAGGGQPYQCGSAQCQPFSAQVACAAANANCGDQSDGCSGVVDCGSCSNGQICGGAGTQNQCGTACTPLTCQQIGATCGPQGDGCNGQIDCGGCPNGQSCLGTPSQCVADVPCNNYCQQQVQCAPGQATRVTGTVYAPNGTEPLYNALVYVPNVANLALPAITTGPNCVSCEDEPLGEPLVAAVTGPDGTFSLDNVPAGVAFPLVVKMGKWRRVTMIPAVAGCSSNVLNANDVRLPRHRNDAAAGLTQYVNIPKFAMVTGQVDAIECVLRKIGIADSEFTAPNVAASRIHLYQGDNNGTSSGGQSGAVPASNTTSVSSLFAGTTLNNYDVAIFDCEGPNSKPNAWRNTLHTYANAGGRVFASHFSYEYLEDNNTYDAVATWGVEGTGTSSDNMREATAANPTTGIIDRSHDKGLAFDTWLGNVNALHTTYGHGYISVRDPRGYVRAVNPTTTERFVYTDANHVVPGFSGTGPQPNGNINVDSAVQQFAFNTPVGAAPEAACGRIVYSAFHVTGQGIPNFTGDQFPTHCAPGALTAQEKALEFMIFDLSACVTTVVPPTCQPATCGSLGATCGFVSDGCGGLLSCGTCTAPETCGGGGTANQCGSSCTLTNCAAEGATCGIIGNGCGGTLNCGNCVAPAVCGGGGTPNVCGTPACTPRSCQSAGANCGIIGDGCGGQLNCGTCVAPATCGGGGPNQCGTGSCTPTGCGSAECGTVGDGCGNAVPCGACDPGSVCGAGGPNQCGPVCTPRTCQEEGKNCGFIGNGCGGVLDCGVCSEGVICGGGGVANVCGGNCSIVTCDSADANCGTLSDGCGGVLNCGTCPAGQVCGAQQQNQCGTGTCTPDTCGALCGPQSDGCSGTLSCGPCNGCVPYQCTAAIDCGPVADGCGALIDCGVCSNGKTCGGGGIASKCGGGIQ